MDMSEEEVAKMFQDSDDDAHPEARSSTEAAEPTRHDIGTPSTSPRRGEKRRGGSLTAEANGIKGLALKPTWFMTNSPSIAAQLGRPCTNKLGKEPRHEHVQLEGSRTRQAQVYPPPKLCDATCRGAAQDIQARRRRSPTEIMMLDSEVIEVMQCPPEEEEEEGAAMGSLARDDVTAEQRKLSSSMP